MKEHMIQEQLQRSLKLAGVQQKPLEESFLLGAAIIAGVGIAVGKVSQARRDRTMGAAVLEFRNAVMPQFEEKVKRIERMTKLVNSANDYDRIMKDIDELGKYVEQAKNKLKSMDLDKVISDEVNNQLAMKWGANKQAGVKKAIEDELNKTIEDLENVKKNLAFQLDSKIDSM